MIQLRLFSEILSSHDNPGLSSGQVWRFGEFLAAQSEHEAIAAFVLLAGGELKHERQVHPVAALTTASLYLEQYDKLEMH